jgi:hypothetical protein
VNEYGYDLANDIEMAGGLVSILKCTYHASLF